MRRIGRDPVYERKQDSIDSSLRDGKSCHTLIFWSKPCHCCAKQSLGLSDSPSNLRNRKIDNTDVIDLVFISNAC